RTRMIWRKWQFWVALVALATVVGLVEGAQAYTSALAFNNKLSWSRALGATMPSWYVLVALLPGIIYLSRRHPLESGRWKRSLPLHLAAAVLFAFLHIGIASWLSDYVLYDGTDVPTFR